MCRVSRTSVGYIDTRRSIKLRRIRIRILQGPRICLFVYPVSTCVVAFPWLAQLSDLLLLLGVDPWVCAWIYFRTLTVWVRVRSTQGYALQEIWTHPDKLVVENVSTCPARLNTPRNRAEELARPKFKHHKRTPPHHAYHAFHFNRSSGIRQDRPLPRQFLTKPNEKPPAPASATQRPTRTPLCVKSLPGRQSRLLDDQGGG